MKVTRLFCGVNALRFALSNNLTDEPLTASVGEDRCDMQKQINHHIVFSRGRLLPFLLNLGDDIVVRQAARVTLNILTFCSM